MRELSASAFTSSDDDDDYSLSSLVIVAAQNYLNNSDSDMGSSTNTLSDDFPEPSTGNNGILNNQSNNLETDYNPEALGKNNNVMENFILKGYINESDIPDEFLCTISFCIMTEVYFSKNNPNAKYEFLSISRWIEKNQNDPTTREKLDFCNLEPDDKLTQKISNFVEEIEPIFFLNKRIQKQKELSSPLQKKKSEKTITKKEQQKLNHHLTLIEHLDLQLKNKQKTYRYCK